MASAFDVRIGLRLRELRERRSCRRHSLRRCSMSRPA